MSDLGIEISRRMARARRRSVWLRNKLPFWVVDLATRARSRATQLRHLHTRVEHESQSVNVYHCCVVKTGSQWVMGLLSDLATYKYSGLSHYHYLSRMYSGRDPRPNMGERWFSDAFPERTIVSPMYIDYPCFAAFPKPERYRAFFVMRDPRDVVVSWYYSSRYSHLVMGDDIRRIREDLECLSVPDGLLYSIDNLADYGLFDSLRNWFAAPADDPNVKVVRYEDLVAPDKLDVVADLFAHLDLGFARDQIEGLLDAHSFDKVSGGRKQGSEDVKSHIRKGTGGGWRELFDDRIHRKLVERAGDLVAYLGYE
jgi:hypothetical protein